MGYSRRKEARENAEEIAAADKKLAGISLGQVCASGMVHLSVGCKECSRKGRYKVTGLIDRYGAAMTLAELKGVLTKDCLKSKSGNYFSPCGCYFPGVQAKGNRV